MVLRCLFFFNLFVVGVSCSAQKKVVVTTDQKIIPAAERLDKYLPLLKGKNIAVFANQTSMVGKTHLVDTLKKLGINIKVILGPDMAFVARRKQEHMWMALTLIKQQDYLLFRYMATNVSPRNKTLKM